MEKNFIKDNVTEYIINGAPLGLESLYNAVLSHTWLFELPYNRFKAFLLKERVHMKGIRKIKKFTTKLDAKFN